MRNSAMIAEFDNFTLPNSAILRNSATKLMLNSAIIYLKVNRDPSSVTGVFNLYFFNSSTYDKYFHLTKKIYLPEFRLLSIKLAPSQNLKLYTILIITEFGNYVIAEFSKYCRIRQIYIAEFGKLYFSQVVFHIRTFFQLN